MTVDRWGMDIGGSPESIHAWNAAWDRFLHFTDDPLELLASADEHDDDFVMGSVLAGTYAVLSGARLDTPALRVAVERATRRATSDGEREHARALATLAAGDFTEAGDRWAAMGAHDDDFAAYRFAHDVFLHVADAERRLHWSELTLEQRATDVGRNFIEGMHSFALNEVGRFDEAREFGERSLAADPLDLWARHALAHLYEDTGDTAAAVGLLVDTTDIWADQDQLALHIWWHLALRLLAVGEIAEVLAIHDAQVDEATTAFRLCDLTSLLWRAELAGHDVGDRWDVIADRWAAIEQRHTCGFLDLHAVLAFERRPAHPGADVFHAGLDVRIDDGGEIDEIFEVVVRPLVAAIRDADAAGLDALAAATHRIGGSNAQRAILPLTAGAFR